MREVVVEVSEVIKLAFSGIGCVSGICCLGYMFGRKESCFVTKAELEDFREECHKTYARGDITNQRITHVEATLNEIKHDMREGFNRILNKIDELPKRRNDIEPNRT